jgi:hypothetical protein
MLVIKNDIELEFISNLFKIDIELISNMSKRLILTQLFKH